MTKFILGPGGKELYVGYHSWVDADGYSEICHLYMRGTDISRTDGIEINGSLICPSLASTDHHVNLGEYGMFGIANTTLLPLEVDE